MINNHFSGTLSETDLRMVMEVPPGGNWKNIPRSIPSKRLEQIRISYENGGGSRSTYYGRLAPEKPSYTISTYFSRPGNGCFIHYDKKQNRLISQREAARLQGFPDDFKFFGSKTSVNQQIGNAVPPILGYQIAKQVDKPGVFIDLFCGAGGLSLGFKWAGWEPLLANDIDKNFTETYAFNVHNNVVCGDITNELTAKALIDEAKKLREKYKNVPFYIIGGPPCQGFSTAGNKRSREDKRNNLFRNYVEVVEAVKPDGFVFENVMGLLSMEKGKVFEEILGELRRVSRNVSVWKLNTEEYAVPQRRKRVVIVGKNNRDEELLPPPTVCRSVDSKENPKNLPISVTVKEALSDLPIIDAGEDGSEKDYLTAPLTNYQKLVRGNIDVKEYLEGFS